MGKSLTWRSLDWLVVMKLREEDNRDGQRLLHYSDDRDLKESEEEDGGGLIGW